MKDFIIRQQSGVALISMLLVFALATVIATEIITRSHRDVRRSENLSNDKQAYHYALSGEQFARQILYRDFLDDVDKGIRADHLDDSWALDLQTFDIDNGEMTIEIHDIQGRLNVNNLVDANGVSNGVAVDHLRRLQNQLYTDGDYTDVLADWLDADDSPRPQGAEFGSYPSGSLPANRPFTDITELRLLPGMTPGDFEKLAPYLVALPKQVGGNRFDVTKYNINTVDATLLEAISGLSSLETKKIEDRQSRGGYDDLSDWLASPEGAGLYRISDQLSVNSVFFEVVVTARYLGRVCILKSQIYRDPGSGNFVVIKRQIGAG